MGIIEGIYYLIKGLKIKSAEKRKESKYRQQAIQFKKNIKQAVKLDRAEKREALKKRLASEFDSEYTEKLKKIENFIQYECGYCGKLIKNLGRTTCPYCHAGLDKVKKRMIKNE